MSMNNKKQVAALVARVDDGSVLAIPPEYSYVPMEIIRSLIRRRIKNLEILCVPVGGIGVDMLIGAGSVHSIEAAAVSLGEFGPAPRFTSAVEKGIIEMKDSTCPAIHTALQASEKGVPFIPLGGLIGSDLLVHRNDWKVINDPLDRGNGRIVLIPAIKPDFALLHSPLADKYGNVWIGKRRELVTMAHAAKQTLVTVERIIENDLLSDDTLAAGTISNLYITDIAIAPGGAKPLALRGYYDADEEVILSYAELAKSATGFETFINRLSL